MSIEGFLYGYIVNEEDYPGNAAIIREGTEGDWVYVILKGKVKVKKNTPKGMVTLATLKEGAIFGEMAMFDKVKKRRTATIIADGPVKIGVLDRERLDKEFESLSPQLKGLIKTLLIKLEKTTKQASLIAVG